jgi:hypothetical protein
MKSLFHFSQSVAIAAGLFAGWSTASAAEASGEAPEVAALRREFDKRKTEAIRPVFNWYEGELSRLERSFTTRGNLDAALAVRAEREASHLSLAQISVQAFKAVVDDSSWRWNGSTELTFRRDGVVDCPEWGRLGYVMRWQVVSPLVVTYSILKGPANVGKDVKLTFAPDLKTFQGINADGSPINSSPRLK